MPIYTESCPNDVFGRICPILEPLALGDIVMGAVVPDDLTNENAGLRLRPCGEECSLYQAQLAKQGEEK